MLWLAPRKSGSGWSKCNKQGIEEMVAAGLMTSAGWAKIEAAKKDGSWQALDAVDALEIPPDATEALAIYPNAS